MKEIAKDLKAEDIHDLAKCHEAALDANDEKCELHKSHENPARIKMYEEYMGEPGGEKAHQLLHTSYRMR